METKHTPGPWRPSRATANSVQIYADDGKYQYTVAEVTGQVFRGSPNPDQACAEGSANARLIAAAPDLLAACERIRRAVAWSETANRLDDAQMVQILSAAIEKATN